MTLQELAQLGGLFGVVASCIYVSIQIRNNTRALRAATFQQMVGSTVSQLDDLARNADLCSLVLRGGDDFESLNRVDKARFRFHVMSHMRRVENAYFQHKIGTLRDADWIGIRAGMEASLSSPGTRTAWSIIKNRSNSEFSAFVDTIAAHCAAADTARSQVPKPHPKPANTPKRRSATR